jgi:hypothetical protein
VRIISKVLAKSFLALTAFLSAGHQQPIFAQSPPLWGGLKPGPHAVGFRVVSAYDHARTYDRDFPPRGCAGRARPIQISVWYPARPVTGDAPMPFEVYAHLLMKEESFGPLNAEERRRSRETFKSHVMRWNRREGARVVDEKLDQLMRLPTAAVREAAPRGGRFPLVVLAQGSDQSAFYHAILCEFLASHGYVVATSPSMGADSRFIGPSLKGAETQARDMEFIIRRLLEDPHTDREKLGLAAFSNGGLASFLTLMRNSNIDALVSLDSVLGFGFAGPLLKQSPFFDTSKAQAPVMHLYPKDAQGLDLSLLNSLKYADTTLLSFTGLTHFDFSSLGVLSHMLMANPAGEADAVARGHEVMGRYVLHFFDAHLKGDRRGRDFLGRKPEENGVAAGFLAVSSRAARKALPTVDQFLNLATAGDLEKALALYAEVKRLDPEHGVPQEGTLNTLGYLLLFDDRVREAIRVFELNVESYPRAFNTYDSLGEAYWRAGNREEAVRNYRKSLELNPDNTNAVEALKVIEKR